MANNTTVPVTGPVIKIFSDTNATTLAASIATQVNTLQQNLTQTPGPQGYTSGTGPHGNVVPGSITVDPVIISTSTNNVITYVCSVRWEAVIIPT